MEETAVLLPLTTEAFLQRLRTLRASIVSDLDSTISLVEKTLWAKGGGQNSAAAAAAPASVSCVQEEDIAALDAVKKAGREITKQLEKVVHRHFEIDVALIESIEVDITEKIREFRPVSAETTQQALSDFVSGANNGDDFRRCLKAGADIDGLFKGHTALMRAVRANHMEAFEIILSDHPDLEVKAGEVPFFIVLDAAVAQGHRAQFPHTREESFISSVRTVIEILLDRGANVNARGWRGETALHRAVCWGVIEVVQLLVDRGADLQVRDSGGQTPHDVAVEYSRSPETLALLVPPAVAE
uniref:Uncharacterized protein n=1 Tax=Chromera velia CCMP2878 TaxID=1169474 RepID=A0A0G4IBA6_9ALVE|eukprot:Cvel_2178.t1-p1 / transcript=Cvel_2178.t1 / gene=Cvel_2178 / organism=Chromera_velia_CCMP2878 / gene_product=E3 ubiquitin-protein ligase mind-bomb, putative / transcript_product=E3 ubiquitin-protein ligase mind-bomb, putative / location=Cvel_scaffold84:87418-88314(-) / protein_length=299 / sequence_SO=supercontig / SO=protein_coding / is_pseudo=false